MSKNKSRLGIAAVAALAISLVGGFEGLRLKAYLDPVGIPTVCFGETKGVKMGDVHTLEECQAMLKESLEAHEAGMVQCISPAILPTIPDKTYVAFLSFTYNLGTGAFCRSTMAKKINAGDLVGACNELPKWNKAGGKELPGLTRRRAEERTLCLEGLRG